MDDSGTGGQGREIVNLVSDDEGMPSVAWGNIHEMKAQIDQLMQESDTQLDKEMDDEAMSPTECFGEDSDIEGQRPQGDSEAGGRRKSGFPSRQWVYQ